MQSEIQRAVWLAKHAPRLRAEDLERINDIYPAYLFRVRKTGEVWTTCCGHHVHADETKGEAWRAVMEAPHHREPDRWDGYTCHMGAMSAPPTRKPELVACPICGKPAKVKELGRTGKRDNLCAWYRVVVLRMWQGALWALAFETKKSYGDEERLTDRPETRLLRVYRFIPGLAEKAYRLFDGYPWTGYVSMDAPPAKLPLPVTEPFGWCSAEGMAYTVINLEELRDSPFRYCQAETYFDGGTKQPHTTELLRYLALCTQWPRQTEMLVKLGLQKAVHDLIANKKWNRDAFRWAETDPQKAFDLSRPELRDFLALKTYANVKLDMAAWYKRLRRAGMAVTFADLEELSKEAPFTMKRLVGKMARYQVTPGRLLSYARKEKTRKGQKRMAVSTLLTEWVDYLEDAALLGYDLTNPIWLMPKELHAKHMSTTAAAAANREKQTSERYQKRLKKLVSRYTFSTKRWLIRPPVSAGEITVEGKALHHCVGGYAERHVKGSTTILFLRDRKQPGKPLVTIEMKGAQIVQIHGYQNDAGQAVMPMVRYGDILDPWLAWLAGGSKRNKDGTPKVPRRKAAGKEAQARTA